MHATRRAGRHLDSLLMQPLLQPRRQFARPLLKSTSAFTHTCCLSCPSNLDLTSACSRPPWRRTSLEAPLLYAHFPRHQLHDRWVARSHRDRVPALSLPLDGGVVVELPLSRSSRQGRPSLDLKDDLLRFAQLTSTLLPIIVRQHV